jgi:large subunit ribosomal protein L31
MQADIHPGYDVTTVVCSCGNTFTTRSTKTGTIHVELCNECHPFFTGKQKLVDSGGRGSGSSVATDSARAPAPRSDAGPATPPGAARPETRCPRP